MLDYCEHLKSDRFYMLSNNAPEFFWRVNILTMKNELRSHVNKHTLGSACTVKPFESQKFCSFCIPNGAANNFCTGISDGIMQDRYHKGLKKVCGIDWGEGHVIAAVMKLL